MLETDRKMQMEQLKLSFQAFKRRKEVNCIEKITPSRV